MKYLILLLIPFLSFSQQDVPEEYWIDDSNFEKAINTNEAFGDDETKPVVIEFWAKFNEANCFAEWNKLKDVIYYRVDISKAPEAKKKYRVRMAPTIIIFKDGVEVARFQADLSFKMLATRKEVQNEINNQLMSDF